MLSETAQPVQTFLDALDLGGAFFAVPSRGADDRRRMLKEGHNATSVSTEPKANSPKVHTSAPAPIYSGLPPRSGSVRES